MLNEQELNHRIRRFLSRKSRKFPGLNYEFSGSGFVDDTLDDDEYEK